MEPRQGFAVGGQIARHQLDGHALAEAELHRLIDRAHAAFANQARDAIRAFEHRADQCIHAGVRLHGQYAPAEVPSST